MILQKNYFSLNLFLIVITILFSFFLEYIFEILPCKICLYQRYLWVGLAVILLFSTFFLKKLVLIKISLVSINLIILLLLGIYHSGIELGYFNNIIKCSINSGFDANSIEELVLSTMIYCPMAKLPIAKVKATLLLDVSTF